MRIETFDRSIDELETDLVVITLYENERPPRGVSGLLDWRLHGFISRMILSGVINGSFQERVLIPLPRKLPARRLLVMGIGKPEHFNIARATEVALSIKEILKQLQTNDVAIRIPKATDERSNGQTAKEVIVAMGQDGSLTHMYLRWLNASVVSN